MGKKDSNLTDVDNRNEKHDTPSPHLKIKDLTGSKLLRSHFNYEWF